MLTHHIQHAIIHKLVTNDGLTFSDLKPDDIDNKLFTYHLKITIREGFVEKVADHYQLTSSGKKLWKRIKESPEKLASRSLSILYLMVHSKRLGWLLYTRKTHPLKDKIAFMHAYPRADLSIVESAKYEAKQKTGLDCDFKILGSGFFRTFESGELLSFTNFSFLECKEPRGKLLVNDPHATYEWVQNPDFSSSEMLPNMQKLMEVYSEGRFPFFIDEIFEV